MTRKRPFRLIILQLRQIRFTDARTFIILSSYLRRFEPRKLDLRIIESY